MRATVHRFLVRAVAPLLILTALAFAPAHGGRAGRPAGRPGGGAGRGGAGGGRRSEPEAAGSVDGGLPRHQRTHAARRRAGRVRARPAVRALSFTGLKNLPVHSSMREVSELIYETCKTYLVDAGEVHSHPRAVHRRDDGAVFRRAAALRADQGGHHPDLQPDRHRRQLRRGLVRHPREHVRELAGGVREPARQAVPDLRHPAARRDEHRHAAHQRRAVPDAVHPPVHSGRLRGRLLHRLRHRRVARRRRAAHRRGHLHQDRRHRLGPDEDRLQHQGRRRAQPGRHRGLHGRQRGRLGGSERRRIRNLRRDGRGAHLVHPAGRVRAQGAGPAARVDLRHARDDDRRERPVVLRQRSRRQGDATATRTR